MCVAHATWARLGGGFEDREPVRNDALRYVIRVQRGVVGPALGGGQSVEPELVLLGGA